jgi:hypothetical protein
MFKAKNLFILTILIASQASLAWAGTSATQSFKLSLTIPTVVGINDSASRTLATTRITAKTTQLVQEQQAIRGNTPVVLKSVVAL